MIAIIDYGLGNLGSILNMLKRVMVPDVVITKDPAVIHASDRLILPGVGAFDAGMESIQQSGLRDVLEEAVLHSGKPVLGICLGMQLLTKGSEEGRLAGLGWIDAETVRFNPTGEHAELRVPHMGWNEVHPGRHHALMEGLPNPSRFYFVHSYHVRCHSAEDQLLSCRYGIDFTCAVQHGNIMGVQFHPEKSHRFGMQLLKNFAEIPCC
jgi:glutamine amidotransferase